MKARLLVLPVFLIAAVLSVSLAAAAPKQGLEGVDPSQQSAASSRQPLLFVENVGQFAEGARFQARGGRRALWLTQDGLWLTVMEQGSRGAEEHGSSYSPLPPRTPAPQTGVNLKLTFVEANANPQLVAFDRLAAKVSYFTGAGPEDWRPDVPVWGGVRYVDLYPGLDLEVTSEDGQLVMRLVCRANCQFAQQSVQWQVEGADDLRLAGGRLWLDTAAGKFALPLLPVVDRFGRSLDGLAAPTLEDNRVLHPFAAGRESSGVASSAILDDPLDLLYSTYVGGTVEDHGYDVAVDAAGNAYVTGYSNTNDFPTTPGAFDTAYAGGGDAVVSKLDATGSALVYSTYLGGTGADYGLGIAVDSSGQAVVTGYTTSTGFPTTAGAFDTTHNGSEDIFLVQLNAAGSALLYGTYIGGNNVERGQAVAIGSDCDIDCGPPGAIPLAHPVFFVGGYSASSDFPTTAGAYDTTYNGNSDGVVVKVNPTSPVLVYSTFIGGNALDVGNDMAVDGSGNAYLAGHANSYDFPTTPGVYDPVCSTSQLFVLKLSVNGDSLEYSTCLGSTSSNYLYGLAVNEAGEAYVTGMTLGANFPTTPGAYDTTFDGGYFDGYVTKFNTDATALAYSTFLGGNGEDCYFECEIAVDSSGAAYVTGITSSTDFPTTPGALDSTYNGYTSDTFVVKMSPAGDALVYGTYLGGEYIDEGRGIALDNSGYVYLTGKSSSSDFPTTIGAYDVTSSGIDVFVTKLAMAADFSLAADTTYLDVCAPDDAVFYFTAYGSNDYGDLITLAASGHPAGTTATFPANPINANVSTWLTIGNTGAAVPGLYTITITGSDPSRTHQTTAELDLHTTIPGLPTLLTPADGATNQISQPTLTWSAASAGGTYTIEIASDSGFGVIVESASGLTGTSYTVVGPLADYTTYYWRVKSSNTCGEGSFTAPFSFTTRPTAGACPPGYSPITIYNEGFETGAAGWTHSGTGDSWTITSAREHSGLYSYRSKNTCCGGSYTDQKLDSPAIALPGRPALVLTLLALEGPPTVCLGWLLRWGYPGDFHRQRGYLDTVGIGNLDRPLLRIDQRRPSDRQEWLVR
ncbi:MAG: SBBP repeat-containing protein [Chloroflexota bacterium]